LLLGYALKKTNFLSDGFVASGNKLVFYVALPATLFFSIYNQGLGEVIDWSFAVFAVVVSIVGFIGIWFVSAIFIKDKPVLGAFAQGAFRGNFMFLGLPLLINLVGDAGMARAAIIMVFVLPIFNICTVLLLAACLDSGKKVGFKTIMFTIVKNPFIIAIGLAFGMQTLGVRLPFVVDEAIRYTANIATPLALVCLGAGMEFQGFDARLKNAFIASIVKLIVLPIFFVGAGLLLGFGGYDIAAILILGGIPSAIAGYTMVSQMGGDTYIAGTIVVLSTLFSAFTLTIFIYILRTFNVIG